MSFYSQFPDYYEAVFPFRQAAFDFLNKRAGNPNVRVVDLGCGTGRYAGEFAGLGHAATGVDLDKAMLCPNDEILT